MIGTRIWNRKTGLVASLLYAVYPVSLFYSLLILKTTLTISMLLCFTVLLIRSLERKGLFNWYALGLFGGLLTCLRGNMLLLIPLTIFLIPVYRPAGWTGFSRKCLLVALGFFSLLLVGGLRNLAVSGEFVLLNSQAGRLFYSCNNPHNLTGRYRVPEFARPGPITSEKDFHEEAERRTGTSLSSDEVSRYWMMETLRFFSEHPGAVPLLLYNKLKATVGSCEIATNHSFYTASMFSPLLIWWPAPFALCIALGLPGLILGIRRDRRVTVLLAPLFTVLVTILIFYSSSRFRMPAVPFLLIGAGILLNALYDWLKKGQMVKSLSTLFFVGVLGVCSISVSCPEPSGTDTFLLAKAYWRQGDLESAERFAREGAVRFPSQARFHLLLGMTAFSRNQPDRALKEYQTALSLDPRSVDACHNMGLVFLEVKRPEEAIFWFQRALAIEERPDTFFYLAKAYEARGDRNMAVESYQRCLDTAAPDSALRKLAKARLARQDFNEQ